MLTPPSLRARRHWRHCEQVLLPIRRSSVAPVEFLLGRLAAGLAICGRVGAGLGLVGQLLPELRLYEVLESHHRLARGHPHVVHRGLARAEGLLLLNRLVHPQHLVHGREGTVRQPVRRLLHRLLLVDLRKRALGVAVQRQRGGVVVLDHARVFDVLLRGRHLPLDAVLAPGLVRLLLLFNLLALQVDPHFLLDVPLALGLILQRGVAALLGHRLHVDHTAAVLLRRLPLGVGGEGAVLAFVLVRVDRGAAEGALGRDAGGLLLLDAQLGKGVLVALALEFLRKLAEAPAQLALDCKLDVLDALQRLVDDVVVGVDVGVLRVDVLDLHALVDVEEQVVQALILELQHDPDGRAHLVGLVALLRVDELDGSAVRKALVLLYPVVPVLRALRGGHAAPVQAVLQDVVYGHDHVSNYIRIGAQNQLRAALLEVLQRLLLEAVDVGLQLLDDVLVCECG